MMVLSVRLKEVTYWLFDSAKFIVQIRNFGLEVGYLLFIEYAADIMVKGAVIQKLRGGGRRTLRRVPSGP